MQRLLQSVDLKTRIAAMVLLLFMLAIWLLAFITTASLRRDLTGLLEAQQLSTAGYVADDLEQSVRLRLDAVTLIASEIDKPLLSDPAKLQTLLRQRPLLRSLFGSGVWVIDARGTSVTAHPPEIFNPALRFDKIEYFQYVMTTGKPVVGKPRIGRVSGKPSVGFAAPIVAKDGTIIGILTGYSLLSDPTLFGSLEKADVGKTGWIAVSAPAHQLIVSSSDPKRILDRVAPPGVNKMFDKFTAGYEGSGVAINSRGIETLTSAKKIPTAGWFAQVVLPTDEAFAPIRNLSMRIYLIAVGLSLLVAVLTWLVIRRLLQPLAATSRQIDDMAFRGGPLTLIDVTRTDEIGVLQQGFNRLVVARNAAKAKISTQNQRIARLSKDLLTAQEEERRRLALEIHDVVSPNTATVKMLLKSIASDLTDDEVDDCLLRLEDVEALTQDTETHLRRICADLRPSQLDQGGLTDALQDYAQQLSSRTSITVQTSFSRTGERLPMEVETVLFRIAQEALTNSVKHARPTVINIHLKPSPEDAILTVADNGVGFEVGAITQGTRNSGLGLLTMRERAEFIGGQFSLESEPGRGTRITVVLPRCKMDCTGPLAGESIN